MGYAGLRISIEFQLGDFGGAFFFSAVSFFIGVEQTNSCEQNGVEGGDIVGKYSSGELGGLKAEGNRLKGKGGGVGNRFLGFKLKLTIGIVRSANLL